MFKNCKKGYKYFQNYSCCHDCINHYRAYRAYPIAYTHVQLLVQLFLQGTRFIMFFYHPLCNLVLFLDNMSCLSLILRLTLQHCKKYILCGNVLRCNFFEDHGQSQALDTRNKTNPQRNFITTCDVQIWPNKCNSYALAFSIDDIQTWKYDPLHILRCYESCKYAFVTYVART